MKFRYNFLYKINTSTQTLGTPDKNRYVSQYSGKMVKGNAKATISGRTIAETDEYEIVEGNIYVRNLGVPL